jgi:hypothetical protein
MRAFAMVVLTALPLVGCSHGPTQPTTSATVVAPSSSSIPAGTTAIYRAQSTVLSVSATLNSCPVDNAVGQTRSVEWSIEEGSFLSPLGISLTESAGVLDPQHWPNYLNDGRTPLYYGSRTGDQFTTIAEQDGGPSGTCFVNHGDLTGSFSPDGLTFDAVENVQYIYVGARDPATGNWATDGMVVHRHWTGTRR